MAEAISFAKTVQQFFSAEPFGRKIELQEIKALTREDREELRELLIAEGFEVLPLGTVS